MIAMSTNPTLRELIGNPVLRTPAGHRATLPLNAAVELYAAVLSDLGNDGSRTDGAAEMRVRATDDNTRDVIVTVTPGEHRYQIPTTGENVYRLCRTPGCDDIPLGSESLTAYCEACIGDDRASRRVSALSHEMRQKLVSAECALQAAADIRSKHEHEDTERLPGGYELLKRLDFRPKTPRAMTTPELKQAFTSALADFEERTDGMVNGLAVHVQCLGQEWRELQRRGVKIS